MQGHGHHHVDHVATATFQSKKVDVVWGYSYNGGTGGLVPRIVVCAAFMVA